MKTILLPTDFSEHSWNAIAYTLRLFENQNYQFILSHAYTPALHRVDYHLGGPVMSAVPDLGVDRVLDNLEKWKTKIETTFPNKRHQIQVHSSFNSLSEEIRELCGQHPVELIAMGTQGASGAKEVFLGSNTVHLIHRSRHPVLAVPSGVNFTGIEKILFPTDYFTKYLPLEIKPLLELVHEHQAELHIIHAVEKEELTPKQEEVKAYLKEIFAEVSPLFEDLTQGFMPNIVHNYAEENQIDLLCMMNRGHSFLTRLMLRQNVDQVAYHSDIPFLVLPDSAEMTK